MAFTTYTDLRNGVAGWLNREDAEVTDRIPDFIVFGENAIFRKLRTRFNEARFIYTKDAGDNSTGVTLPGDFKEAKLVKYAGRGLYRESEQNYAQKVPVQQTPQYYHRQGNRLVWLADENADVELVYYNQQPHISDAVIPTLYTEYPELYLFGALHEARGFLKATDAQTIANWRLKFEALLVEIQEESDNAEFAGSTNQVGSVYPDHPRYYNVYPR